MTLEQILTNDNERLLAQVNRLRDQIRKLEDINRSAFNMIRVQSDLIRKLESYNKEEKSEI